MHQLLLVILAAIFNPLRINKQIKSVSITDYSVSVETVKNISEEHYRSISSIKPRRAEQISNYIIHLENGESWQIPQDNYLRNTEHPMSDSAVYESAHRGYTFTVITKKDTGKIVMAYNTDLLVYRN